MARDEFFRDVRRALSFVTPRVDADSTSVDTEYLKGILRRTDSWLARGVVSAFHSEDFSDLSNEDRDRLERTVHEFRNVADTVHPKEPAKPQQREAALAPFMHIVNVVQHLVREDWMRASNKLLDEAEGWAQEAEWPTKRYPKDVLEDFIGKYTSQRLIFAVEGSQLALLPVGRFAPGTDGMFDLAVMPAYDSVMVVRKCEKWFIHPLPDEEGRRNWSKEVFLDASLKLARLP